MKKVELYINLFLYCSIAILLYGCTKDNLHEKGNTDGSKKISFKITLTTPQTTPPRPLTKSGQTEFESTINQVDILVFENDNYQYTITGDNITNGNNQSTSFTAHLVSNDVPTTLYILANTGSILQANPPQIGESSIAVKSRINQTITATPISGALIMWGTYEFPSGISSSSQNTISNIRMLRSVSRVDVIASTVSNIFELVSIQAFRVANNMQIIPNNATTTPSVSEPSIPTGTNYTVNTNPTPTSANTSIAQLYLPESVSPSSGNFVNNATCVVIGARYAGSNNVTYYRLDFNPNLPGNPTGQILRNHRYEFTINSVRSAGFATPQEAADNMSTLLDADIVIWQDYIKYMRFDQNNYFGCSEIQVHLAGEANSTHDILVDTDALDYTLIFSSPSGIPTSGTPTSSISDDYFDITKSPDGSMITIIAKQENPINADNRIRYVLVTANSLRIVLAIIQEDMDINPGPGGVIWSQNNINEPFTFAPIDAPGMFYQWNRITAWANTGTVVGWDNQEADGIHWSATNDPSPSGWRLPTVEEYQALINSPGKRWRLDSEEGYIHPGVWFAPTQEEADAATFDNPGNALFFPSGGIRDQNGNLSSENSNAYYWCSDLDQFGSATIMSIADGTYITFPVNRATGGFLRCVRD